MNSSCARKLYLREAAGRYWLVDMTMDGAYSPPRELNETGAFIVRLILDSKSDQEIISIMSKEFEIDVLEAESDYHQFRSGLGL